MLDAKLLDKSEYLEMKECLAILKLKVKTSKRSLLEVSNIDKFTEWLEEQFTISPETDYAISVAKECNKIIGFQIGIKINLLWQRQNYTFPYWFLGVHCHSETQTKIPGPLIGKMALQLMNHFENQHYYTFYAVVKLPKNLDKSSNIDSYLDTVYQKNYPLYRYNRYIEKVIRSNDSLEEIKQNFIGYTNFFPKKIDIPILLLKHEMKNNFRKIL